MGLLPIRHMSAHHTKQRTLAAHAGLAGLAVGHESLAGGQDGDAEAAEDAGDLVGLACRSAGPASTPA